jgi:hypothetical protein
MFEFLPEFVLKMNVTGFLQQNYSKTISTNKLKLLNCETLIHNFNFNKFKCRHHSAPYAAQKR